MGKSTYGEYLRRAADRVRGLGMSVEITPMTAEEPPSTGCWRITPKTVTDERGTVREFFRTSGFAEPGCPYPSAGRR